MRNHSMSAADARRAIYLTGQKGGYRLVVNLTDLDRELIPRTAAEGFAMQRALRELYTTPAPVRASSDRPSDKRVAELLRGCRALDDGFANNMIWRKELEMLLIEVQRARLDQAPSGDPA